MKVVSWFLHVLLIFAFLGAGFSKLLTPYTSLREQPSMDWVGDFTPGFITFVSIMEILGAIGLSLPLLVKKFEFLVPIAAFSLGIIMILAAALHITRDEPIIVNLVLLALSILVGLLRRRLLVSKKL